MKDLLAKAGCDGVEVDSAALHTDEIGSDTHYGTKKMLVRQGIPFTPRRAWLLTAGKAAAYDLIVGMDEENMRDLRRLLARGDADKARKLLSFAGLERDVADPWYTGDFDATYADVSRGCAALLKYLKRLV